MDYNEMKHKLPVKEIQVVDTVGTTEAEITLNNGVDALIVTNINEAKNVLVSFDGGTTWSTVLPATERSYTQCIDSLYVKGSEADTIYELSYLERQ